MPATAQNQQNSSGANSPAPTVSDPKRPILPILILILVILGAVIFLFMNFRGGGFGEKNIARVGSDVITEKNVSEFASACNLDNKQAVDYLIDEKVLIKWAFDEEVSISESQVNEEAVRVGGLEPDGCYKTIARANLFKDRLLGTLQKYKEGKFIVVNFDKYFPSPFLRSDLSGSEMKRLADEEKLAADELINSVYSDISGGKISFEEGMSRILADEGFGEKSWYSTSLQSGSFTAVDYDLRTGLLNSSQVFEKVNSLGADEVSEPFTQSVSADESGMTTERDVRWIVAKVDRLGDGFDGTEDQLIGATRDKYKATIL